LWGGFCGQAMLWLVEMSEHWQCVPIQPWCHWKCCPPQMMKSPGKYGLQLPMGQAGDLAALRAAIRARFMDTAVKQLTQHGLVS